MIAAVLTLLTLAADAPPPPSPLPVPAPWACTVDTLLAGVACTFEGAATAAPQPLPAWRAVAADVCARVAGDDAAVKAACDQRAAAVLADCVDGTGAASAVDVDGRFVAAGARCYVGLAVVARDFGAVGRDVRSCCGCLGERVADKDACTVAVVGGRRPLGADSDTCRPKCAAVLLRTPPAPTTSKKKK